MNLRAFKPAARLGIGTLVVLPRVLAGADGVRGGSLSVTQVPFAAAAATDASLAATLRQHVKCLAGATGC